MNEYATTRRAVCRNAANRAMSGAASIIWKPCRSIGAISSRARQRSRRPRRSVPSRPRVKPMWRSSARARPGLRRRARSRRPDGVFALIEASDRVGGRWFTDNPDLRRAVRRGAQLGAHSPTSTGGEARGADRGSIFIRRRRARNSGSAGATRARARWRISCRAGEANRAIQEAARGKVMSPACRRCQRSGRVRPAWNSCSGRFLCQKSDEVSAVDFARSLERDVDAFCRQGLAHCWRSLAPICRCS